MSSFIPASGAYRLPTPTTVDDAMIQIYDNIAPGAIASWDVSGISQAYNHLWAIVQARGDNASTAIVMNLRFNNDSGGNYYTDNLAGNAASATAAEQVGATALRFGGAPAASAQANSACIYQFLVRDYTGTTFSKAVSGTGGRLDTTSSAGTVQEDMFGVWNSTASITRITILPSLGNFIAGSRLSIYGIL